MFEPLRLGRGCNCLEDHPVGLGIRGDRMGPPLISAMKFGHLEGEPGTTLSLKDENDHHSCCLITY